MARSEEMSRTRMQAILDAYGADARRWPAEERAAAEAWAAAHGDDFATMAREAQALDAALALDVRESADDAKLAAQVSAILVAPRPANDWWRPVAALAACAVLGVAIGFAGAPRHDDIASEVDAVFGAAFDLPGFGEGAGG
ncbi:MAG: hypothetical protein JNM47_14920 [Hyphomonadaceae bacterium]|nr:hypothetical protein [Hyphomonadaceae bacterium]